MWTYLLHVFVFCSVSEFSLVWQNICLYAWITHCFSTDTFLTLTNMALEEAWIAYKWRTESIEKRHYTSSICWIQIVTYSSTQSGHIPLFGALVSEQKPGREPLWQQPRPWSSTRAPDHVFSVRLKSGRTATMNENMSELCQEASGEKKKLLLVPLPPPCGRR